MSRDDTQIKQEQREQLERMLLRQQTQGGRPRAATVAASAPPLQSTVNPRVMQHIAEDCQSLVEMLKVMNPLYAFLQHETLFQVENEEGFCKTKAELAVAKKSQEYYQGQQKKIRERAAIDPVNISDVCTPMAEVHFQAKHVEISVTNRLQRLTTQRSEMQTLFEDTNRLKEAERSNLEKLQKRIVQLTQQIKSIFSENEEKMREAKKRADACTSRSEGDSNQKTYRECIEDWKAICAIANEIMEKLHQQLSTSLESLTEERKKWGESLLRLGKYTEKCERALQFKERMEQLDEDFKQIKQARRQSKEGVQKEFVAISAYTQKLAELEQETVDKVLKKLSEIEELIKGYNGNIDAYGRALEKNREMLKEIQRLQNELDQQIKKLIVTDRSNELQMSSSSEHSVTKPKSFRGKKLAAFAIEAAAKIQQLQRVTQATTASSSSSQVSSKPDLFSEQRRTRALPPLPASASSSSDQRPRASTTIQP